MKLFLAAKYRYPGSEVNGSSGNWSGHCFNSQAVLQAHSCDCCPSGGGRVSLVTATATGSHGTHELQSAAGAGAPPLRRNCQVGDGGRSAAEDHGAFSGVPSPEGHKSWSEMVFSPM